MSEDSNKKDKKLDLNKVEEPATIYHSESHVFQKSEEEWNEMPEQLKQLIDVGLKQIELGQTKSHEQVMAEMKLKHSFK